MIVCGKTKEIEAFLNKVLYGQIGYATTQTENKAKYNFSR